MWWCERLCSEEGQTDKKRRQWKHTTGSAHSIYAMQLIFHVCFRLFIFESLLVVLSANRCISLQGVFKGVSLNSALPLHFPFFFIQFISYLQSTLGWYKYVAWGVDSWCGWIKKRGNSDPTSRHMQSIEEAWTAERSLKQGCMRVLGTER